MADEINYIKVASEYFLNKQQASGYLDNEEYNAILKTSQLDEINYQRKMYESGSITKDNLLPLKKTYTSPLDTNGRLNYPSDYMFLSALRTTNFYTDAFGVNQSEVIPIDILKDNEVAERLSNQITKPDNSSPCAELDSGYIQLYPSSLNNVSLVYIKKPSDPIWGFTVTNNEQVYDSATSTNIELPFQLVPNLIRRVCSYFGISVRQQDVLTYMEQKQVKEAI